ncbi:MAG TPA: hypothetical protein VKH19_15415, partial [Gemmatimonadaceae bacterium]|nr:hypothetical protein [Gemmatimonadaceae bacterium]
RRHTSTGWHIESAQFSDGGVFDNGPLGLGIGLHYNGAFWPDQFAKDSAPPLIVYVNPDRRRAWPNGPAETQTEMQDDGRLIDPRSSGVAAVFSLIGGAIPSARQQELQQTVRILKQLTDKRSRGPDSLKKELMFASTRWHPIAGARLSGFGAFLGEPLREYDFYVGIYDAFATIADGLCARTGRRDARFECVRAQLGRFVKQPPIELGSVAPQVLGRLYAREFRTKGDGPLPTQAGQPRLNTRSDSATYVVLAVERAMGAFMQDTTAEGRKTARKLQKCSGDNGGPLVSVLCGSGLHAVLDTLKNDMLVHALLAQRHDAGGGSCSRKSPPAESWPCTADERFLELVDQPFLEMHRLMRSLLDRMIVTTPDSSAAGIVVRAAGAYYFSSDERYRRGIDGGQTSLPPRQERWQLLPSSLSAFVGISGTIVGWEARVNPWAHLGLAWPVRLGIGRFAPDERDAFDRRARIITGPVAELKIHKFGLSTIRWGYNAWLGRDSASSHSSLAGKTVSYGGVTLFGNKVRVSMSRPPNTLQRATNRRYLYEVGLSDLNGLLYWALQGERGGKQPFRSEPTDMNGCLPHEVRAPGKLGVGDFAIVSVVARVLDNKTGVMVDSGAMYRLSTAGRWKDGRVRPSTAAGFRSGEAPLRGAAIGFGKPFRRANAENANWFTLMGYIGTEESSFIIGEGNPSWTAPKSGELVTYANDVKAFYGNNRGCVTLIVERLQ